MATILELEKRFADAVKYHGVLFFERVDGTLMGDVEVLGPHLDLFFPADAVIGKPKLTALMQVVDSMFGRTTRVYLRRAYVRDARFPDKNLRIVTAVFAAQ